MLATRVKQKESTFYFVAYRTADLLEKVKFTSRYYFEGEELSEARLRQDDEVAQFIAGIERSEKGFQRVLNRQKIKQIVNFYETVLTQPMVPGTVLLFTDETLSFRKLDGSDSIGHLSEPKGKYLVIDGQHRLAGLQFFKSGMPIRRRTWRSPASCSMGGAPSSRRRCSSSSTPRTRASTDRTWWTFTKRFHGKAPRRSSRRRWSTCSMGRPTLPSSTRSIAWAGGASRRNGSYNRSCSTSCTSW